MKTLRFLAAFLFAALAFFDSCPPAHAGHWDLILSSPTGYAPPYTTPQSHLNPTNSTEYMGDSSVMLPATGSVTNYASGTATADFYWVPDPANPNDAPPATLRVKETPSAMWDALSVNQVDDIIVDGGLDDGRGDPQQVVLNTRLGEDDDNWDVEKYATASNSHLLSLSVDQTTGTVPSCSDQYWGHATVSCSMSGTPEIADTSPYGYGSLLGMFLSYQIVPDNRAVTINADVDVTNMKTPSLNADGSVEYDAYNNIVFQSLPHQPAPDGTMYGDIGTGYGTYGIPAQPDTLYPVDYTPHLAGNWGAASTYSWYSSLKSASGAGPTFGNTYFGASTIPTDAGPSLIMPGETGQVDHIFLSVTDSNDGTKGTANYYLALHQPVEWYADKRPTDHEWRQVAINVDPNQSFTNDSSCSFTYNADNPLVADVTETDKTYVVGALTVAGASTPSPALNGLLTFAGYAIDKFGPVSSQGTADFALCFGNNNSTFTTPPPANYAALSPQQQDDIRAEYKMTPYYFVRYTKTYYIGDNWDLTGYEGEQRKMLETLDRSSDGTPATGEPLGAFSFDGDSATPAVPTYLGL